MPFTVVWDPSALDELAQLWLQSSNRQAVADAADRIDHWLRLRPQQVGRDRQVFRVLAVAPLVVAFEVSPDDCLVHVLWVNHEQ